MHMVAVDQLGPSKTESARDRDREGKKSGYPFRRQGDARYKQTNEEVTRGACAGAKENDREGSMTVVVFCTKWRE